MWRMLQQNAPEDFVLATGETHTVREFADLAFRELEMPIRWEGTGPEERGVDERTGSTVVVVDRRYYRPTEVELLVGNAAKAKEKLGWSPKTKFVELARMMAHADFEKVSKRGF
jgi:GDPmannose 4,6-dehydratase